MKFLLVIFMLREVVLFFQKDYIFIVERISLEYYNKEFFEKLTLVLYFYTRYEKRANILGCLKKDIYGLDLTDQIQGYKFQSNEYRLFPFTFSENACEGWGTNKYGIRESLEKYHTNVTIRKNCSMKKGCFYINSIFLDDSKFPPFAPRGRYLLDYYLYYNKTILLLNAKGYVEIKPSNPLEFVIQG